METEKQSPLVHFAIRTEQENIDLLKKLAIKDDRKLRTMANMALKIGIASLIKRSKRVKR